MVEGYVEFVARVGGLGISGLSNVLEDIRREGEGELMNEKRTYKFRLLRTMADASKLVTLKAGTWFRS